MKNINSNPPKVEFGEWQQWFAWRPVFVSLLQNPRRPGRLCWLQQLAKRTITTPYGTRTQYVLADDLLDYLTSYYDVPQTIQLPPQR